MNVNLISLESSANCSSAALLCYRDGDTRVDEKISAQTQGHAEQLLPMIDSLLVQAGLTRKDVHGVVFGQGPGGFTGLRIAAGMAQGLGLGLDIPVFPVSSLLAVAESVRPVAPGTVIASVLDARMQEAFVAAWQESGNDELQAAEAPSLLAADQIPAWIAQIRQRVAATLSASVGEMESADNDRTDNRTDLALPPVLLAGSGISAFPEVAAMQDVSLFPDAEPRAGLMARIGLRAWMSGRFIPADQAAPLYVRDKVAFTTQEREAGQGGNPRATPLSAENASQQKANPTSANTSATTLATTSEQGAARHAAITHLQTNCVIRPMCEEDIEAVVRIECAVQSHPWTVGNFRDALKAGYEAWVVCHEQQIIAFSLQMMAPDVSHLLLIGVLPEWQKRGLGAGLLAWGETRVLACGLQTQVLEVRPSNTGAVSFYQRWGYEQIGVRKGYYPAGRGGSEDAWVLQKAVVS